MKVTPSLIQKSDVFIASFPDRKSGHVTCLTLLLFCRNESQFKIRHTHISWKQHSQLLTIGSPLMILDANIIMLNRTKSNNLRGLILWNMPLPRSNANVPNLVNGIYHSSWLQYTSLDRYCALCLQIHWPRPKPSAVHQGMSGESLGEERAGQREDWHHDGKRYCQGHWDSPPMTLQEQTEPRSYFTDQMVFKRIQTQCLNLFVVQ